MEIYGLSDLIRKILLFNRAALLSLVETQTLENFFQAIGIFSCYVIQQAAIEESVSLVFGVIIGFLQVIMWKLFS